MNGTATLPAGISIRLSVLELWGWRSCLYPSLWDGSSSEGFVLAVAGHWGAIPTSLHGMLHPRECSHGGSHLHPHIQV